MLSYPRPTGSPAETDAEWFDRWRRDELGRLDAARLTYLDYTGAAPHPVSLIRADCRRLERAILGNPHSEHPPSKRATRDLEGAREAILAFLGADPSDYGVVLTANASAACRLVGESFPWSPGRPFVVAADNHNSVNGIGEYARREGAPVRVLPLGPDLNLDEPNGRLVEWAGAEGGLFAFPAQSNFSGVRHPLELIERARDLGYRVLLDAASFLPTCPLDLSLVRPDFVALSIYKIAGYPTGVGALVARRDALAALERPWFAGGTVDWVSMGLGRHQLRGGVERFEDGTPSFLAAGAIPMALDLIRSADRTRLARHLTALTTLLLGGLAALRHRDGRSVVTISGPPTTVGRGATIALSVSDSLGRTIPYWDVEAAARSHRLAIRGGCFCNPGCAEAAFGMSPTAIAPCLESLGRSFTIPRLADCFDGPVGAVRLSLGLGSVEKDVTRALAFFERFATER